MYGNGIHPAEKPDHTNPKIFQVVWELRKSGKAPDTIRNIGSLLRTLDKYTDIENPEAVKTFLATSNKTDSYKRALATAYNHYVKFHKLTWTKPEYNTKSNRLPKIPLEQHIEAIMVTAPLRTRTAIAISKDTGLRPIELMRIKPRDINLQNGAIYPTTAKRGSPRVLKLTNRTINLLNQYLASRNINPNENLFGKWTSEMYGKSFRHYRNRTAKKLQDPAIKTVRLYDLRHYFATMTYHKTKDILFVKQQMGHRSIESTLVYTQLLQFDKDDNYTCRIANSVEQATELIENGFEYVTEIDGTKLFRKRK